jgi:hypothetical protein
VQDISKSRILAGKTKPEVQQLLGEPDAAFASEWGYEVVTISRCYFWKCRMQIAFDPQTGKATGDVAVSD